MMDEHISDLERALAAEPENHATRSKLIAALRRAEKRKEANVHVLEPRYAEAQYSMLPTSLEPFAPESPHYAAIQGYSVYVGWTLLCLQKNHIKLCPNAISTASLLSCLENTRSVMPLLRAAFGNERDVLAISTGSQQPAFFTWPSKGRIRKWAQVARYLRDNYVREPLEEWHR